MEAAFNSSPETLLQACAQVCGDGFRHGGLRVGYRETATGGTQWMHVDCMSPARWRAIPGMLMGLTGLQARDRVRAALPGPFLGSDRDVN